MILVGEMRDHETIETALLAAETGHLVLSTLHTLDGGNDWPHRLCVSTAPAPAGPSSAWERAQGRRFATAHPESRRQGTRAGCRVMIVTPFIRDCIIDKEKTHLIRGAIAQGTSQHGMQTFDQSIYFLYEQHLITRKRRCAGRRIPTSLLRLQGITSTTDSARDEMARAAVTRPPTITRFGGN